jgi:hypothetical protein
MNTKSKEVIVIGGFTHEGLEATVRALGCDLTRLEMMKVGPKTWKARADYVKASVQLNSLVAAVIYLHTNLLLKASEEDFQGSFFDILRAVGKKGIIFVFQDNLDGCFTLKDRKTGQKYLDEELENSATYSGDRFEWALENLRDYESRKSEVDSFMQELYTTGVEVAPFYQRSDVRYGCRNFYQTPSKVFFFDCSFPPTDFKQNSCPDC